MTPKTNHNLAKKSSSDQQIIYASALDSELVVFLQNSKPETLTIQSVFQHACNIQYENKKLITLLYSEAGLTPSAINVELPVGFSFIDCGIKVGQPISINDNKINLAGRLIVDLENAKAMNLLRTPINVLPAGLTGRLDYASSIFRLAGCNFGFARLFEMPDLPNNLENINDFQLQAAIPAIQNLLDATKENNSDKMIIATKDLLGLGIGLTPSGDDFLLGFFAVLHLTKNIATIPSQNLQIKLESWLQKNVHRTTLVSANFLLHAIRGRLSQKLNDFCIALLCGNEEKIRKSCISMQKIGASSGFDIAAGVIKTLQKAI